MAALVPQFETCLSRIEPSTADKTNAALAHADVRATLALSFPLVAWGNNPVLIGSYARSVSIRRMKDVDVFCRLETLPSSVSPAEVLNVFKGELEARYGQRVEPQARSVKIDFPNFGLSVDAVPARQEGDHWEIPDREGNAWQSTNPERLGSLTTELNDDLNGKYVHVVKLVRQARRSLLGRGAKPSGLWFEIAAYWKMTSAGGFEDHIELFALAMESAVEHLSAKVNSGTDLADPALPGGTIASKAEPEDWRRTLDRFDAAATEARRAVTDDKCAAAARLQSILGSNEDFEWVFPRPYGCGEDGTGVPVSVSVRPGEQNVTGGPEKFAS